MSTSAIVIGDGWIGRAVSSALGVRPIPRRTFDPRQLVEGSAVLVASGRAAVPASLGLAQSLKEELNHLRTVLDTCEQRGCTRIVVLGSSDVAGMAPTVTGASSQDPRTDYAAVKAAVEDECVLRRASGVPVSVVRLAPVHGPGKARTAHLARLARLHLVPVPNGGRRSIGFVLIDDAVGAVRWLLANPSTAVVAVGGGRTPLRSLLVALAEAQGTRVRLVPVPVPVESLAGPGYRRLPAMAQWMIRLSMERSVEMEVPTAVTPLEHAAKLLVS